MVTRRTLLKAAAGAATVFVGTVPGLRVLAATTLRVRRSVNSMALDDSDLDTYREFVRLMRSKAPTEPVSWVGFANQHGNADSFKFCPHGDWYFLPWHRGFVEMYEKAAAVLMRNPKFAMPYWDWTTLRDYPEAFSSPTYKGRPNPLFSPGEGDTFRPGGRIARNRLGPGVLTDSIVGVERVIDRINRETVFERFGTSKNRSQTNLDAAWVVRGGGVQGILEATPHNQVHNSIGGFMGQSNSPRDPIFMMHHGNIDRIWEAWNSLGRKNSTNKLWLNMSFRDNYLDPQGRPYTRGVKDVLRTSQLGYTYDDLPRPDQRKADPVRESNMVALLDQTPSTGLKRVKATASSLEAPSGTSVNAVAQLEHGDLTEAVEPPPRARPKELVALISDIQVPENVGAIRVFVNHPAVSHDVPDTDPHFVTTIAFLHHGSGDGEGHHKALPSTIVDLTETLRGLSRSRRLSDDSVTVQLVPVPLPGVAPTAVAPVVPASVEIAVL